MQKQLSKVSSEQLAEFIYSKGDELKTDSLKVAEAFGKRHADVMRAIRNLKCSEKFNERNFAPVEYIDQKGEERVKYEMETLKKLIQPDLFDTNKNGALIGLATHQNSNVKALSNEV